MSDHDADIARAAALTMKAEAEIAILACVNREKTIEWLLGLKAAFEAVAALPLPGDAP
jgi:post-segregation antitoxin (ccd killing protein)